MTSKLQEATIIVNVSKIGMLSVRCHECYQEWKH